MTHATAHFPTGEAITAELVAMPSPNEPLATQRQHTSSGCRKNQSEAATDPIDPLAGQENTSTLGLVELLLKRPERVDRLLRARRQQRQFTPRLMGIALAACATYGVIQSVVLWKLADAAPAIVPESSGPLGTYLGLVLAYTLGFLAAHGVCLPSFYFYTLLAGVRVSMLEVTAHALKSMAAGSLALLGILPLYTAGVLAVYVLQLSPTTATVWLYVGLALPFLAGLWGVRSLYQGLTSLADRMKPEYRQARECFLRRLTLSWSGVLTAVSPVMILALWTYFAGLGW